MHEHARSVIMSKTITSNVSKVMLRAGVLGRAGAVDSATVQSISYSDASA